MTWTASDDDGDLVLFTVQFTADNGVSWETLQVIDPALGVAVSTKFLAGGNQCLLRVMATDGFNTTVTTSAADAVSFVRPV